MLGGVRASCGPHTVEHFPTQHTAALLGYLAIHPQRTHTRETLAELFWPDAEPNSQRHSLRLALSRLRALFGPDHPLETGRVSIRLNPTKFVTDVAELEAAIATGDSRTASRLAQGPFMPGHYGEWVIDEQVRIEALLDGIRDGESTFPDNLPQGLGRFFGREAERKAIAALFGEGRIVTLTAPGGMGKTRLAIAVAREHGRTVWVPLADLSDASQVADAIRMALRLPVPAPGFPVEDQVARELLDVGPVLLLLDNAENLVGPPLSALARRMANIPRVLVLITSRRLLEVGGEVEFSLGPLGEAEGVALFEERARRARPGLAASDESLRGLVQRFGGIPLALELAAARAGVQGLEELALANWSGSVDFGEALGIPARHRSLEGVLRESLALLPADTGVTFARLGMFRGGFDKPGAMAVAGADIASLETLRRWSLILPTEESDGSLRFRMPEPLRDIASTEWGDAALAHARYFADWVEANRADDLPPPPRKHGQRLALQERERDNIRAALETCAASKDPQIRAVGLRIVAAFWTHWYVRNASLEMEEWARSLLSGPGEKADPLIRASAQLSLGLAIREKGVREPWVALIEEALKTLETGPRDRNLAFAWHLRGFSLSDVGRNEEAERAYLESEAIWLEILDERNFAITRHNRAMLAQECGELDKAEKLVGEAMELFRAQTSTYVSIANATIGSIRKARGDFAGAAAALREAARLCRELGYVRGWAQNERDLAVCLQSLGQRVEARTLAEGALSAFQKVGDRHGEATALAALARVTGETWHAEEALAILERHHLPAVGELLEGLNRC